MGFRSLCCNNLASGSRNGHSHSHKRKYRRNFNPIKWLSSCLRVRNEVRSMAEEANVAALIGSPALDQIVDKFVDGKSDSEKKEMIKKIEVQLVSFNGKERLTVDEYYSVLKVQFKINCTKNDIRKVVADLPMDKSYKILIKDFSRLPILSDDVFKAMDRNGDGEVSKGELKLANKNLTMKQIQSIMTKLDNNGDGTISWKELKN